MFSRQKLTNGTEININVNNVNYFSPAGEQTKVSFMNGEEVTIDATVRTIRSQFKKAAAGGSNEVAETVQYPDPAPVPQATETQPQEG